eukprot:s2915_g8.t1
MTGHKSGTQLLITTLGGQWGKVKLEKTYEIVEKALFKCIQRQDESNDSFLARCDVIWSELKTKKIDLEQIHAYIVLRGSLLSSEDKKRILESESASTGALTIDKVSPSVRMLGTTFFNDMIGLKKAKGKIYDQQAMLTEDVPSEGSDGMAFVADELGEEDFYEQLLQEEDEDAVLIADYESAAADTLIDALRLTPMKMQPFCDAIEAEETFFTTHGMHGILDTGATKSVIGSGHVPALIESFPPEVQRQLSHQPTISATSLASRLDRVIAQGSTDSVEAFRQLPVEEMGEHRITFGRTHVGRTYSEMWATEKGWVRWFSKVFADSQKDEHRKVLIYIEAMVTQHEQTYNMTPLQETDVHQGVIAPVPKAKTWPKSKAAPAPAMSVTSEINEEVEPWDPWDIMDQVTRPAHVDMANHQQEVNDAMQTRILHVENALTEILNHVRQANHGAP